MVRLKDAQDHRRDEFERGFNSKMVRLKIGNTMTTTEAQNRFQFQNGSIKSSF